MAFRSCVSVSGLHGQLGKRSERFSAANRQVAVCDLGASVIRPTPFFSLHNECVCMCAGPMPESRTSAGGRKTLSFSTLHITVLKPLQTHLHIYRRNIPVSLCGFLPAGHTQALVDISPYKWYQATDGRNYHPPTTHVVSCPDTFRGRFRVGQTEEAGRLYAQEVEEIVSSPEGGVGTFIAESIGRPRYSI